MFKNNIADLNLIKEILPLYDFCINNLSKNRLALIFQNALKTEEEINDRQDVIKGFIANLNVLEEYNYSKIYFHQVYDFLNNLSDQDLEVSKMKLYLFSKNKSEIESKLILFINLFEKILNNYLNYIDSSHFPEFYNKELMFLKDFLNYFNLSFYKNIIRQGKLSVNDIIKLTKNILSKRDEFFVFYDKLLSFEAYLSIAKATVKNNFSFPSISQDSIFLEDVYHPFIKNPISNTVQFNKNVNLLTGPNMSGKSTFLKSLFITIYLGHLGISVPASKAKFPFFDYFSISINHNDDIKSGYSHFMNEIISLKTALEYNKKGYRCFIIFDELFKGTNIEDALKISAKTVKGLLNFNKSYFFISTHLNLLENVKEVEDNETGNYYVDCKIENEEPIFTYKLKEGWSDLKIGQILFKNSGIDNLLKNG